MAGSDTNQAEPISIAAVDAVTPTNGAHSTKQWLIIGGVIGGAALLTVGLCAGMMIGLIVGRSQPNLPTQKEIAQPSSNDGLVVEQSYEKRAFMDCKNIEKACQVYYVSHHFYPQSVQLLTERQEDGSPALLSETQLLDPWRQPQGQRALWAIWAVWRPADGFIYRTL